MTRLLLVLGAMVTLTSVQAPPAIIIDGEFEDWARIPVAAHDAADALGSPVDVREVRVVAEGRSLYVAIDVARPVNLQTLPGTLSLVIDADGNSTTGETVSGLPGADLAIDFAPPGGTGVMVRRFPRPTAGPASQPSMSIGLAFAPRYSATRFEIRFDRGASARLAIKAVFLQNGEGREETDVITVDLPPLASPIAPAASDPGSADPIARADGATFRIAVWNVGGMALRNANAFRRVLTAIDADVLILDEVSARRTPELLTSRLLPEPATGQRWQIIIGEGGERGVVATTVPTVRAFGKVGLFQNDFVAMVSDAAAVDRGWATADSEDAGVGVTGAFVTIAGRRLLAVPIDLACCANEARRVIEATAIRAALQRAVAGARVDGLIVGGDFNLVGTRDPLDIVRRALDLDGSALEPVAAPTLGGRSMDTWRSPGGGRFPPGRLDWLLHSDSSLEVVRGFVFDTAALSPDWLARYGLWATDSTTTSDHLPIVADFRWKR